MSKTTQTAMTNRDEVLQKRKERFTFPKNATDRRIVQRSVERQTDTKRLAQKTTADAINKAQTTVRAINPEMAKEGDQIRRGLNVVSALGATEAKKAGTAKTVRFKKPTASVSKPSYPSFRERLAETRDFADANRKSGVERIKSGIERRLGSTAAKVYGKVDEVLDKSPAGRVNRGGAILLATLAKPMADKIVERRNKKK